MRIPLAVMLQAVALAGAFAQETPAPDQTLDPVAVQDQLSALQARSDLDLNLQNQAVEAYNQALIDLATAADSRRRAEEFRAQLANAPDSMADLSGRLAEPVEPAPIAMPEAPAAMDYELGVARAQMDLAAAQTKLKSLEDEGGRRAERRKQLPQLLAEGRTRLSQAELQTSAPVEGDLLATSRSIASRARVDAIRAEVASYEQEFLNYEVSGRLLTLQQDLAQRELSEQERKVQRWQEAAAAFRREELRRLDEEARRAWTDAAKVGPRIREFAEASAKENRELINFRTGVDGPIRGLEETTKLLERTEGRLNQVRVDFKDIRNRVEATAGTEALGSILRSQLGSLPKLAALTRSRQERAAKIAGIQVAQLELRIKRGALGEPEKTVNDLLSQLDPGVPESDREKLREILLEQVKAKRDNMDALLSDYTNHAQKLQDLDGVEMQYMEEVKGFRDYIAERALWIRSTDPVGLGDARLILDGVRGFLPAASWSSAGPYLIRDISHHGLLYIAALLPLLLWLARVRALSRRFAQSGGEAVKKNCSSIRPTLDAAGISLLVAGSVPLPAGMLGWRLAQPIQENTALYALGVALGGVSLMGFVLRYIRQFTRPGGLGLSHFDWPERGCRHLRRDVLWLMIPGLPLAALVLFLGSLGGDAWPQSLGRVLFIALLLCFAIFAAITLRPRRGGLALLFEFNRTQTWNKQSLLALLGVELACFVLAVLALLGYYYSAERLGEIAFFTAGAAFMVYTLFCFGQRWLLVIKRRLHREQRRKRIAAAGDQVSVDESLLEQEAIYRIDEQSQKLLLIVCSLGFLLICGFLWSEELPALKALEQITVWNTTASTMELVKDEATGEMRERAAIKQVPITLLGLTGALAVAGFGFLIVRNVPGLLEVALLRFMSVGSGERYAITTLSSYVLVVGIVVWTFNTLGVGWSQVQWLVAALSLGLGFGLQEIFANFVSGIIVLFERPVRVGDVITVGGQSGTVTKIKIRATTIRDFDRKELIIPNKDLVTGQLLNWTLSDAMLRVVFPVGIAFGSEVNRAEAILVEILNNHPYVAKDPAPRVLFQTFGDNSLNFEVQAHCLAIENVVMLRHELHKQIEQEFRLNGIEMAFPQRDVHVREPIQIVVKRVPKE
ncbi:MAG: mechanosensitive ion channel [Candidatus Hydrogenedentes bacterium]|nr:mechanosensitive ion channel [Candidatus Hydrogenedentota bacterium]